MEERMEAMRKAVEYRESGDPKATGHGLAIAKTRRSTSQQVGGPTWPDVRRVCESAVLAS